MNHTYNQGVNSLKIEEHEPHSQPGG
jgi:hypothetical protein